MAEATPRATGISNRETADEEARERREHPPIDTAPSEPDGGPVNEEVLKGESQTSHKAGARSVAQKTSESRYADRSMPATRKVAGAFGAEGAPQPRDAAGSSHPGRQKKAARPGKKTSSR